MLMQLRLMQLLLSSEALKLVPNYADAQCTDLTAMAGQWRIVEYLARSNANLETQPRRNARDGKGKGKGKGKGTGIRHFLEKSRP